MVDVWWQLATSVVANWAANRKQRIELAYVLRLSAWFALLVGFETTLPCSRSEEVQTASVYSGNAVPQLAVLGIRCADRPIDLQPPFDPNHYIYSAFLDFSEGSFAVDALPAPGMRIVNSDMLLSTALVGPGEEHRVDVNVEDSQTKATMEYTVTVSRLDGMDLKLKSLDVGNARLIPPAFDPLVMEYFVGVLADQDYLSLSFAPWDSGQTFVVYAQESSFEDPFADSPISTTLPRSERNDTLNLTLFAPGEGEDSYVTDANQTRGRRLSTSDSTIGDAAMAIASSAAAQLGHTSHRGIKSLDAISGEVQYQPVTRRFAADPDVQRIITIVVRPANGDISNNSSYLFKVTRSWCPSTRPFFAPDAGACASTCNVGFYADQIARRCKACSIRCKRCTGYDACAECHDSKWEDLDFVELIDGYCQPWEVPQDARRRRLLLLIIGTCVVLVLGCCGSLLCSGMDASGKRRTTPGAHIDLNDVHGDETNRLLVDGEGGGASS